MNKQIEEMAKVICFDCENRSCAVCKDRDYCRSYSVASNLYNTGYRKASDVGGKIFEEIAKATGEWGCYCLTTGRWGYLTEDVHRTLAELKKKYESEGVDNEKNS